MENDENLTTQVTEEGAQTQNLENTQVKDEDGAAKEVENKATQTEDSEDDGEDIEFDDDGEDGEDDQNSNQKSQEDNKNQTHKQSRADNKKFAQQRREAKQKTDLTQYQRGVKETLGGVNPYTKQKIETPEDVDDYLLMKEMEAKGLDPTDTSDYIKFSREKNAEKVAKEEETRRQEETQIKYQNELSQFKAKYPDVDIEKLVDNDKVWNKLIISQVRSGIPILEAYENAISLINNETTKRAQQLADEKTKKVVQNAAASVGSMTDGEDGNVPKVDVKKMSDAEFKTYWEKNFLKK